jgi:hypothetical protein
MLARTRATDTSLRKLLRLQVGRRPRPFPSTPVLTGTGIRKRLRSSFAACRFHQQVCSPVPQIVRSRSYYGRRQQVPGALPDLRRIMLPVAEAPELLKLLSDEGIDASVLFPGPNGVVRAMREATLWRQPP